MDTCPECGATDIELQNAEDLQDDRDDDEFFDAGTRLCVCYGCGTITPVDGD